MPLSEKAHLDELSRAAEIAQQLHDASSAHFEYETTVLKGVYDQQWGEWYAEYLLAHDWNALFTRAWDANALAETLRQLDREQRERAPQMVWSEYYAQRLAELP